MSEFDELPETLKRSLVERGLVFCTVAGHIIARDMIQAERIAYENGDSVLGTLEDFS